MDSQQQQQHSGEGENYTNILTEHHVQSAIEMGLQSRQQTYQEFMDSFLYLTNEDVKKFEEAKMKKELEKLAATEDASPGDHGDQQAKLVRRKADLPMLENIKVPEASEDELETEELGEGTYSPRCTDAEKYSSGKKFVQVDNFVEDSTSVSDSDDDNIMEDEGGGYVSSFGQVKDASVEQNLLEEEEEESLEIDQGNMEDEKDNKDEDPRLVSPLPGEAVDICSNTETPKDIIHQTQLDICVKKLADGTSLPSSEESERQDSTNEVQPFSLDENFDYDNVVLSTKWDLHHRPPNLPQ